MQNLLLSEMLIMNNFYKMKRSGNVLTITRRRLFENYGQFSVEQLNKCITFAREVEQRSHRSGGSKERTPEEIFFDTVEGKLGEFAVINQLSDWNKIHDNKIEYGELDFQYYPRGKWDTSDLTIRVGNGDKNIQIKTSRDYSQLLLLEQKDWNSNGEYSHSQKIFDYIFLQRIKINEKRIKALYKNNLIDNVLDELVGEIYYDKFRYISHDELRDVIKNNFVIRKNEFLNKTLMDADNYYVQIYDMHILK